MWLQWSFSSFVVEIHLACSVSSSCFLPRCMECRRGLAMRILSVRLSVKRVDCDKTAERSVQIYIPYERTFSLVFWEEEWLVGAAPSTWNIGSAGPRWSKIIAFEPIIARSASAVTPSEKSSINANRKSTTRFPMSLRWSSYVAPKSPKEGSKKRKTDDLRIGLLLKKVCYKVSLCENCQRQSCKTFIGLTNRAKMIGEGATQFYLKFWVKVTALERNLNNKLRWLDNGAR